MRELKLDLRIEKREVEKKSSLGKPNPTFPTYLFHSFTKHFNILRFNRTIKKIGSVTTPTFNLEFTKGMPLNIFMSGVFLLCIDLVF